MASIADTRLIHIWEPPEGIARALGTVDHKVIGIRYIVTAFIFFCLAGLEILFVRLQLARPENNVLSPEVYNQFFTMHGTTMIFFFATPILSGFGNVLIPLMIGARDMAYPRLNAFGYWVFLFSGLLMYSSFIIGQAPDGGWFAYVPLTGPQFSPGLNIDFWSLGLIFLSISSTAGAINFIVTIFKMRAPGMSINRMPLYVWAILVTSFAIVFAVPPLTTANILLELERKFGFHFFQAANGGNPLLWQHLFWIFGHPDVYIIFLPGVGIVSEIVGTFSRRRILGYTLLAMAVVTTGIIGFGVWVHHMFAVGISPAAANFFSVASVIIGIPSGIQIFAWLGTMLTGRPVLKTPFLWITGFVFVFVIGGLSGVMFPAVPFDRQVTDTYFVVAHFHYVLVGGTVFPIFGAFYYWIPKMSGKLLNERLGQLNFWTFFVGFNLTFFPMHILGLDGMPRRIYTYEPNLGWDFYNLLATIGAVILTIGVILFVVNLFYSLQNGEPAGDNPWNGSSLEWATSSPPPPYNFRTIPVVHSREPLWEPERTDKPDYGMGTEEARAADPTDPYHHETLSTSTVDAIPEGILLMSNDTYVPLFLSLGLLLLFIGVLVSLYWLAAIGALAALVSGLVWLWPTQSTYLEAQS